MAPCYLGEKIRQIYNLVIASVVLVTYLLGYKYSGNRLDSILAVLGFKSRDIKVTKIRRWPLENYIIG